MDKTDVELLWVLQQSSPDSLSFEEIKKKNKTLLKSDNLEEKIELMQKDGLIEINKGNQNNGIHKITKKGIDLIWKGETWKPIFNLIKLVDPEKYTSNEIRRITNKSLVECVTDIEYLRKELKLIEGQSKRFKLYFVLSEKGRSYEN
ncbi:hypothetical protein [Nitrosopumilus sp.]|uniref:hypothetical protein n=1 Tax=Nitrosopumilus sp. TaxID=2024843 RepID=UPI003B5C849A